MTPLPPDESPADPTLDESGQVAPRWGRNRSARRSERSTAVSTPGTLVFQASPTTISAALARINGAAGTTTIVFPPAPATATSVVAPVFVVGGGAAERERLGHVLGSDPSFSVGDDTDALVRMCDAIEASLGTLVGLGYPEQYWYKTVAEQFTVELAGRAAAAGQSRLVRLVDDRRMPLATLDRMFPRSVIVTLVGARLVRSPQATRRHLSGLFPARRHEVHASALRADPEGTRRRIASLFSDLEAPQPD